MKRFDFRILLVYPNIPMMLVTPLSIAIFAWVLRKDGYEVDFFARPQKEIDTFLVQYQTRALYGRCP
ncbi:MAG: hypothetical protein ABIJ37_02460 [Pseudomonadota bacterium]